MHFLMGDPRKTATMILASGLSKKKPESNGGGEKKVEHSDRGQKLLDAIHGRDEASLISALEDMIRAVKESASDDNPSPTSEAVDGNPS